MNDSDSRLVIGAPFGNDHYIRHKNAIRTIGTYTRLCRPGRWLQVARTVRHANGGWINQLGLRNPGVESVLESISAGQRLSQIVSIHGFNLGDWDSLLDILKCTPSKQLIELNVSCPNVADTTPDYLGTFQQFARQFPRVIVKLPPINYQNILEDALVAGVKNYHCCNSYPTPIGGISGPKITPYAIEVIRDLRGRHSDLTIIGGGGITRPEHMDEYRRAGADYFAIASGWFNPSMLLGIGKLAQAASKRGTERML